MHQQFITLFPVFVVAFLLIGGIYALNRLFGQTTRNASSRNASAPHRFPLSLSQDEVEDRKIAQPSLMPPPLPRDDFEFYQAGQFAIEHDLPLPSPPPKCEHEEW